MASREIVTFDTAKTNLILQAKPIPSDGFVLYQSSFQTQSLCCLEYFIAHYMNIFIDYFALRCHSLSQIQDLRVSIVKCVQNSFIYRLKSIGARPYISGARVRSKRFVPLRSYSVLKHGTLVILFVDELFDRAITKTFMKTTSQNVCADDTKLR